MTSSVHRIGEGDGRSVHKPLSCSFHRLTRCPTVGHVHVHNKQSTRKHYPNYDSATPSAFHFAGGMDHANKALFVLNMLICSSPA